MNAFVYMHTYNGFKPAVYACTIVAGYRPVVFPNMRMYVRMCVCMYACMYVCACAITNNIATAESAIWIGVVFLIILLINLISRSMNCAEEVPII